MQNIYDVLIIGSGPGGLTAAVYSSRAQLKTVVFQGDSPGGQLTTTTAVENWPGEISIQGPDLMIKMQNHARSCGAELKQESIAKVDFSQRPFRLLTTGNKEYLGKTVIIGTGAKSRMLGCPGEAEYFAKGVSTCATCDGLFYRNKDVVIVGGGNTAMTEADHLLHFVKSLTIIQLEDTITANDPIKFKVLGHPKVRFIYGATVSHVHGDGQHMTGVTVRYKNSNQEALIDATGMFLAIGFLPNTDIFKHQIDLDAFGYIQLNGHTQTSVQGVFAVGDVADYRYRQAITSAGTGCMAALDAQAFLAQETVVNL